MATDGTGSADSTIYCVGPRSTRVIPTPIERLIPWLAVINEGGSFLMETRLLPAFIAPTLVVTAVCLSSCKQAERESGSWSRPARTNARRSEHTADVC